MKRAGIINEDVFGVSPLRKNCVFCGKNPIFKNNEHVIPQWLIKHTGDPKREVILGKNWHTGKIRKFSFNNLKFPACSSCNSKFAKLEGQTKKIILNILTENPLSSDAFNTLLNWFDKVRIGLWLGFTSLNQNFFGITPKFHIEDRVAQADRMLLILKLSGKKDGLYFSGIDTPSFLHTPSCFALGINQFFFINISTDFLFSRRLGLPHPSKIIISNDNVRYKISIAKGRGFLTKPLIKQQHYINCTEIYQPIIRKEFLYDEEVKNFYSDKYVINYLDIRNSLLGEILIKDNCNIIKYPKSSSKQWIPKKTVNWVTMGNPLFIFKNLLLLQNHVTDIIFEHYTFIDPEKEKIANRQRKICENFNKRIIECNFP